MEATLLWALPPVTPIGSHGKDEKYYFCLWQRGKINHCKISPEYTSQ